MSAILRSICTFHSANIVAHTISFLFLYTVFLLPLQLAGLYCELLAADKEKALPSEKKEVLTYMKEHEEEMFPPSFSFSTSDGKQPENRELFGDILTLLDELDLKSEDVEEPDLSVEKNKDDPLQTDDGKRPSENTRAPSDSSGDNGHPPKGIADSASNPVEVHEKV